MIFIIKNTDKVKETCSIDVKGKKRKWFENKSKKINEDSMLHVTHAILWMLSCMHMFINNNNDIVYISRPWLICGSFFFFCSISKIIKYYRIKYSISDWYKKERLRIC